MTPIELVISRLSNPKRSGNGYSCRCPAHEDRRASLSIAEGDDGRALLNCKAGCAVQSICDKIGISLADLFPECSTVSTFNGNRSKPEKRPKNVELRSNKPSGLRFSTAREAIDDLEQRNGPRSSLWTYLDAKENPVGVIVRWDRPDGKEIRPIALIGEHWHIGGMPEPRPLYCLPNLIAAMTVYICEGEKAADAVQSLGLTATTSVHGSQSPTKTDWTPLAGKQVVILPDNDKAGRGYADTVAAILGRLLPTPTIKIVELPGLPAKGDAVEWIAALGDQPAEAKRAQLERLAKSAKVFECNDASPSVNATPMIVRLCEVRPEPIRWLWPGRIALGKLTIVSGDPGLGKSFLSCDLAARVSIGDKWPDDVLSNAPRGGVVMLNCEDDLADTIRPRLDKHGADVSKVIALAGVRDPLNENRERQFNLARDIPALESAIREIGDCRIVVIDPVTAYLGDKHDSHKASDVRSLLAPLAALAAKHSIAVVGISHLNKGSGAAMYRTMGSLAFVAAARAVWCVTKDQENPARRLFLPVKNNLGNDVAGLAYSIVDGRVEWEADPVSVTADEALAPEAERSPRSEVAEAEAWLLSELVPGVPTASKSILNDAREQGISEKRLRDGAKRLGVVIAKGGMRAGWNWTLPEVPECTPSPNLESSASSQNMRESSGLFSEDGGAVKTEMFDAEESSPWGEI